MPKDSAKNLKMQLIAMNQNSVFAHVSSSNAGILDCKEGQSQSSLILLKLTADICEKF